MARMVDGASDYFSIDVVLAEETAIPCAFQCGAQGIGRALDASSGLEDVKPGAAVDLPVWLLVELAKRDMIAVKQPKWYKERMRRKIQAGAGVENLRLRCPYFYDVALLLHSMERGLPLAEFAMQTFQARYKELLIKAHSNQTPQEMTRLESLLSSEEAVLFEAGRISMSAFSRWRFGGRPLAQRGALKRRLDGGRVNARA